MSNLEERTLTISGLKVVFPCKPYPSQFGMMDRVIKGLERKQNSLLESPTGSGKSLALLCSALAWQNAQHEKVTRENLASAATGCCKPCQCGAAETKETLNEYSSNSNPGNPEDKDKVIELSDDDLNDVDDDDDFKPSSRMRTPNISQRNGKKRKHLDIVYDDVASCDTDKPVKCTCNDSVQSDVKTKQKVAKIYFGTRTHKQIAQIIRELKKTAYHDVRMAILASREYTCVHPEVTKLKNKSEGCRERLDISGPGCRYNDKSKRVFLSQKQLQQELTTAWDLEDFVTSCNRKKACPYFVTRNIKEGADIVFCPYNYLIDPLVRNSMEINLKDQVVILDEAHNIEDCARDAASGSLTTDQITQAIHNLQQLMEHNIKYVEHLKLRNMLENLLNFIEGNNSNLDQSDYNTSYKVWSGFDIVVRLKGIGLGPDNFKEYQRSFEQAVSQNEDEQVSVKDRRNQEVKMSSNTQKILEQLFQILDYMYRNDVKFVEDYRVAIMKSMQYVSNRDTADKWLGKNRRGGSRIVVYTLNFWCMNPAVAFSDFSCCRNIVLSSGTLSPMSSFASELGTPFPIQLEANHIIQDKQVWVGAIGVGPSGNQLQAVYRNMETFSFQDELGNLIYQVCTKVPHGVLCFVPSYRALEKFTERWKLTGLWSKLASRKRVMIEPRAADREDFDGMMKAFYEVVKGDLYTNYCDDDEGIEDNSEIDGALFFAVCRGKVSEGMDFADNNARAVITVGIPFPSIKDVQVKLKREYNDKHRVDRGLLSGSDWYEIQAFRALNQALGRCIRHRKDWGALIIVDDRFVKRAEKYCKSLSRWVRSKVKTYDNFSNFLGSMSKFTETMVKEMPTVEPDTSFIPCTPGTGRRDSVYKRQSLDSSYLDTSENSSPQFKSPPMSETKSLTQTPESAVKGNNPQKVPSSVTSPSIQQQIMDVLNSGTAPKNQPYYVIFNQGTPSEQAFLIDPGSQPGSSPVQTKAAQMVPQGQSMLLNLPGTGQQQQVLLSIPKPFMSNSYLQLSQVAFQDISNVNLAAEAGNQQNKEHSTERKKIENETKEDKKSEMVFMLGSCTLPVEEQLKKFVNSAQAPRNKAYYVVVNKGEKNEKAFFIEPNKKGKSKAPLESKAEKENIDEEVTKSKPEQNIEPDQTEHVGNPVQSKLEQNIEPDQTEHVGNPVQSKLEQNIEPDQTEHEGNPVQSKLEQNIEPDQTEHVGNPVQSKLEQNIKPDQTEHVGNQFPCKEAMKPIIQELQVAVPDSSTGCDPEPQNKFLKFCTLPKTPSKVPVASVTPQRLVKSEQESSSVSSTLSRIKTVPDSKKQQCDTVDKPSIHQVTAQKQPICTSPVLFEDQADFNTDTHTAVSNGCENNAFDTPGNVTAKKKRIFKKRHSLITKNEKSKHVDVSGVSDDKKEVEENTGENNEEVGNDTGVLDSDFRAESSRRTLSKTRGKMNSLMSDKVKEGQKLSTDGSLHPETIRKPVDGIAEAPENDAHSDEEFLNTRRRGSRKRKSTSKYVEWSKRSKKGVVYNDDVEEAEKENMAENRFLSCVKCGKNWLKVGNYEKHKRHPEFLAGVCKRNTELLYFPHLKTEDNQLQAVDAQTNIKGLQLNSVYDENVGCCIEYLGCKHCNLQTVIGARVLLADSTSHYTPGQTWILSSETKQLTM